MQQKNQKKLFIFQIIASELRSIVSFKKKILVISSECVNKKLSGFSSD